MYINMLNGSLLAHKSMFHEILDTVPTLQVFKYLVEVYVDNYTLMVISMSNEQIRHTKAKKIGESIYFPTVQSDVHNSILFKN